MKLRLRSNLSKFIELERSKAGFKMSVADAGSDSQPAGYTDTQPDLNAHSDVARILSWPVVLSNAINKVSSFPTLGALQGQ